MNAIVCAKGVQVFSFIIAKSRKKIFKKTFVVNAIV
jgi:hypothetical protein